MSCEELIENGVRMNAISWKGCKKCSGSVGDDCNVEGKCEE